MTGNATRCPRGRPLPDGPAPFLTLVELTWHQKKIEHWIRFGRKSYEQILDRHRSIVGFAPGDIFAFVRWAASDFGTVVSRIDIVRAIGRGEPFQTIPLVRPVATSCCGSTAGLRSRRHFRLSTPRRPLASIRRTSRRSTGGMSTTV